MATETAPLILITGGLGFIGRHTALALAGMGCNCVLTQRTVKPQPPVITEKIGTQFFTEQLDINNTDAFLRLGEKYPITGIIHLAGSLEGGKDGIFKNMRSTILGLSNVLQAASIWKVNRVIIASAIGVYNGDPNQPWKEEKPVPCTASYPIEAYKKTGELYASLTSNITGVECITARISGVYGPMFNQLSGRSLPGKLVHAAVREQEPDLSNAFGSINELDGFDWNYVKDCGRALAMLQMAEKLNHKIYNVASGKATNNVEFLNAIKKKLPGFRYKLPAGFDPGGMMKTPFQDISRLKEDAGFTPAYNVETGIADYINWLQSGNEN